MDSRVNDHEVIQFTRDASQSSDQLDTAGQTILQLIQRAAGVAEDTSRQSLEMAQKLSQQLRSAEARVAQLEAEVDSYRQQADRAEQWLHRIYTQIENQLLRQSEHQRGVPQRRRA